MQWHQLCAKPHHFCKSERPFYTLTCMFYNLSLQIQTIEEPLQYKVAPLTPPNLDPYSLALLHSSAIPIAELCFRLVFVFSDNDIHSYFFQNSFKKILCNWFIDLNLKQLLAHSTVESRLKKNSSLVDLTKTL